jgi:hypothetical protein
MNIKTTRRPRLGLVAGVLAVAVAASSGAYAAGTQITSSNQIKKGVVNTGDLKDNTVKVKDLAPKTVEKLQPKLEDWHVVGTPGQPSLNAPWAPYANGYHTPAFRKNSDGEVMLRGGITAGADIGGSTMFVLPEGYRPSACGRFVVATTDGGGVESEYGSVTICPTGLVYMDGEGDDRFVSLESISFSVA